MQDPNLVTSHVRNMSAQAVTWWSQVQQSFPMNSDPPRAIYKKVFEEVQTFIGFTLQTPTHCGQGWLGAQGWKGLTTAEQRAKQPWQLAFSHWTDIFITVDTTSTVLSDHSLIN